MILLFVGGCATVPQPNPEVDPWESWNRSVYSFNEGLDRLILKPVAQTYREYTPQFIQTGIGNFLSNLGDILVIINDLLQLKFEQAGQDMSRFLLNSTVGLFGFFDVASPIGLPKHDEDFGQTLGYWGVDSGPYLVLPFFGPSTLRERNNAFSTGSDDATCRLL
ncbi:MAG: VacJ family lipoprotein, partial [Pseudomonadota bacterium]